MRKWSGGFLVLLISGLAAFGVARAAETIVAPGAVGASTQMMEKLYLKLNTGETVPAKVCFGSDGNGNLTRPLTAGGAVAQGAPGPAASPWPIYAPSPLPFTDADGLLSSIDDNLATKLDIPLSRVQSVSRSDSYSAIGSGTASQLTNAGIYYSIQVVGITAGATLWDVRLECSLDGTNFTTVVAHTNVDLNGTTKSSGATPFPCSFMRSRVAGLTLGSATGIAVYLVGQH